MTEQSVSELRVIERVTLIGAVINLLLGGAKILVGTVAHSAALIADGIHSLSDLASDVVVVVASRIGRQAPDDDHHYGHGRYETLGAIILAGLLLSVAGGIAWDSLSGLIDGNVTAPAGSWALLVAAISVASKEWLYHYTHRAGRQLKSELLKANAWHHRSDSLSSIVVIVGIAGTMVGIGWFDKAAALLVALMVAKIGFDVGWGSVKELVDTAIPQQELQDIRNYLQGVDGVAGLHMLRTRQIAGKIFLDVHIDVAADLSITEAHLIGVEARKRLMDKFPDVLDATFHVDPLENVGDDQECDIDPGAYRQQIETLVSDALAEQQGELYLVKVDIHYMTDHTQVEIFLDGVADVFAGDRLLARLYDGAQDGIEADNCRFRLWLAQTDPNRFEQAVGA